MSKLKIAAWSTIVLAIVIAWLCLRSPHLFPIQIVQIDGNYWRISESAITHAVDPEMQASFFHGNLTKIRKAVLNLSPWIESVDITRAWPNTYRVTILQKQPYALWNDDGVMAQSGEVFYPEGEQILPDNLPVFSGAVDQKEAIRENYFTMQQAIQALGLQIAKIEVSAEGNWQITFNNQTIVMLGNHDILGRFDRFIAIYKQLVAEQQKTPAYIDMRYSHGVAVKWASIEEEHGKA